MKNTKILFLLVIMFFLSLGGYSQSSNRSISKLFKDKIEVYFSFSINDREELHNLTKIISIDKIEDKTVYAYANKKQFKKFATLHYKYKILTNPGDLLKNPKMLNLDDFKKRNTQAWNAYPTYSAYVAMMNQFQTDYPALCKVETIGTLGSGHKLLIAKISKNVNNREYEPQFLYTSSMHGDEITGYVLMLRLMDYLLANYGKDPSITSILDNTEIWICPLANPDGTFATGDNTVSGATRSNKKGVDLNRNYPDPQDGLHPDGEVYQEETQSFMAFTQNHDFVMAANFHGGSEVVNYPWDTWTHVTADKDWWLYVSQMYADTVHKNGPSGYFTNPNASGITNGYNWYEVNGGRQDYMNWWKHCRELTIELSTPKTPTASTLPNYWNYNYKSFLNFINQSLWGIKGIVTDSCSGQPLKAKIRINNHDKDSSEVYTSLPIGNYHRPIYSGTYSMIFSAPGYTSKTINNVTVTNGNVVVKDVQLAKTQTMASFTYTISTNIVSFINNSMNASTYLWDFGDGVTSVLASPTHTYANVGTYTVKLIASNGSCSNTVSENITITITNVAEYDNGDYSVSFYPNPSNGISNLIIKSSEDNSCCIQVTDFLGHVCINKIVRIYKNENSISCDLSAFPRGIYIAKIGIKERTFIRKICVQ